MIFQKYVSAFAAAGLVVIEGRALPCLKAPLLRWGSSAAQGNGEHGQRCVFLVGPDVLIGPFSGGPVCRPYEGNRNLILHPARATARVAPTASREHMRNPGGRVRTPAPTADAEASCPFVGAGHWPARQMASAIPEPTLIRLAYARHLLPGREKAFG